MKKICFYLIACVLLLAIVSIPNAQGFPSAGTDIMPGTTAEIGLDIIGVGSEDLIVVGPTVVRRSDPYDPGDGRWTIDTEIVSMKLVGISALVGPITIVESPTKTSSGAIQQQVAGEDFPADSFFDVFVEIEITGYPLGTLSHDEPIRMSAVISSIPPWEAIYIPPEDPIDIPLKDEDGNIVGSITHVTHKIPPPPTGVPEFSFTIPAVTSIAAAIYLALRKRIGKKPA